MERSIRSTLLVAALFVGTATPTLAQSAGDGYLFHRPNVTFSARAGYSHANAGSDVFDDVTSDLTLDRGDFSSFAFGGDIAAHVSERVSVVLSAGQSSMTRLSFSIATKVAPIVASNRCLSACRYQQWAAANCGSPTWREG